MSNLKDVFTTLENTQVEPIKKIIDSIEEFLNKNSSLVPNSSLLEREKDLPTRIRADNHVLNVILESLVDYLEEYISSIQDAKERLESNPDDKKINNYLNLDKEVREYVYIQSSMFEFLSYIRDRI